MEIQERTKTVRFIEYDGKRFYEDGKGYWLGQQKGDDGTYHRIRLHIYVWEKFNGPVPDGYDVHHVDEDTSNNELSNLILMERGEHHRLHSAEHVEEAAKRMEIYARPAAVAWHKSDAGREWHRKMAKELMQKQLETKVTNVCEYCGKEFEVPAYVSSRSHYCSNNCKSAARRKSGVDDVVRKCSICGKEFVTNKYSRVKTCCKECANISEGRVKIGKPRPRRKAL